MKKLALILTLVMFAVSAQAALTVTNDGADYTLTSTGNWEMKIDMANGAIWSFKDLTDNTVQNDTVAAIAGFVSGDHYSYLGRDGYNKARSLLWFSGRSTGDSIMTNSMDVPNRYAFTMAPDNSSFQITYTESLTDGYSVYFCGDSYDPIPENSGYILMDATITINDAAVGGTVIDWEQNFRGTLTSGDSISQKYFLDADFGANSSMSTAAYTTESVLLDATYSTEDGNNPTVDQEMWSKVTVDDTAQNAALGLVAGREFTMTRDTGFTGLTINGRGEYDASAWAGLTEVAQGMPGAYGNFAGDFTLDTTGTLTINIAAAPEPTTMGLLGLGALALLRKKRK